MEISKIERAIQLIEGAKPKDKETIYFLSQLRDLLYEAIKPGVPPCNWIHIDQDRYSTGCGRKWTLRPWMIYCVCGGKIHIAKTDTIEKENS